MVDLRRVTFIDSIALGILLSHQLRAEQAGRRLALVDGPPHVRDLFELTGIRERFEWIDGR